MCALTRRAHRLTLAAEWRWLKVTARGAPALPLRAAGGGAARRPYETLLLARSAPRDAATAASAAAAAPPPPPPPPPLPREVTLLGAPGAHSRKPRLHRLLRPFAPGGGAQQTEDDSGALHTLELFARELAADATAWGDEPLRFQAAAHFVPAG